MRRWLRRAARGAGLWAVVAALAALGAVFVAIAAYLALSTLLAPPLAALVTGAGSLLLAGLVALLARHAPHDTPPPAPSASGGAMEKELALLLGRGVAGWIAQHPRSAAAGAFATGVVSGMSPRARRTLIGLLREGASLLNDFAAAADKPEDR